MFRRFQLPVPVGPYTGVENADAFGPACPQQGSDTVGSVIGQLAGIPLVSKLQARADVPPSEDCKA